MLLFFSCKNFVHNGFCEFVNASGINVKATDVYKNESILSLKNRTQIKKNYFNLFNGIHIQFQLLSY